MAEAGLVTKIDTELASIEGSPRMMMTSRIGHEVLAKQPGLLAGACGQYIIMTPDPAPVSC